MVANLWVFTNSLINKVSLKNHAKTILLLIPRKLLVQILNVVLTAQALFPPTPQLILELVGLLNNILTGRSLNMVASLVLTR